MLQGYCRGSWVVQWYTDTVVVQGYTVTELVHVYRISTRLQGSWCITGIQK